jgi:hypothetical protein
MNILDLKCGSKFILTENFATSKGIVYPKNLVVSVVRLYIGRQKRELMMRILVSKKIVEKYYSNMDTKLYKSTSRWRTTSHLTLYNEDIDKFISENKFKSFDKKYKSLNSLLPNTDKTMNTILIQIDQSCSMAMVLLNDKCIMEGNFWDFHPGCHGINTYGDFDGYLSLAFKIKDYLLKEGKEVEIVKEPYTYED